MGFYSSLSFQQNWFHLNRSSGAFSILWKRAAQPQAGHRPGLTGHCTGWPGADRPLDRCHPGAIQYRRLFRPVTARRPVRFGPDGPAPLPVAPACGPAWSGPSSGLTGRWTGLPGAGSSRHRLAPVTNRLVRSVARSDRVLHRAARPQARLTGLLEDLLSWTFPQRLLFGLGYK